MKKKGPRAIPDFSTKRKDAPAAGTPDVKASSAPPPALRVVKPTTSSSSSGHRG